MPTRPPRLKLPRLRLPQGGAQVPGISGLASPEVTGPPVLSPEEESSLLQTALGGVQYVGEMFDKPGAALRGLLAGGGLEQLAHAVPFSDALGLSPRKKYSGRELLHELGLASRNKPGFRGDVAGDLAGFAAEVALDPLWLLAGLPLATNAAKGLGAAGKAAKATQTLGAARKTFKGTLRAIDEGKRVLSRVPPTTPAAMAQQIRAGERGLVGLKLPFAKEPMATFGKGSKVGAWALEKAAYGGGLANPVVWMRGLFSHSADAKGVKEFFGGRGALQRGKDLAFAEDMLRADALMELAPAVDRHGAGLADQFAEMAKHHGGQGDRAAFDAFTRSAIETADRMPTGRDLAQLAMDHLNLPVGKSVDDIVGAADSMADDFHQYLDAIVEIQDTAYERLGQLGADVTQLNDIYIPHTARRASAAARLRTKRGDKILKELQFNPVLARRDIYRNLPGGTRVVNALARDPLLTGTKFAGKGDKVVLRQGLRDSLDRMGVAWDPKESIPALQQKHIWNHHLKSPHGEAWGKLPQNAEGQLIDPNVLDEAGEALIKRYTRGPKHLRGQPITAASEQERFVTPKVRQYLDEAGQAVDEKVASSQVERLVRHFRGLDPAVRERGIFDRAPFEDAMDYTKSVLEWESTLRTAHHFLAQKGVVWRAGKDQTGKPLRDAWNAVAMKGAGKQRPRRALTDQGLETFVRNNAEQLGVKAEELADDAIGGVIDNLRIAPGAESILDRTIQSLRPDVQGEFGKLVDQFNSLWKGWLFTPWPAAHSRNLVSGAYQSWSDGHVNIGELGAGYKAAYDYLKKGGTLDTLPMLQREGVLGKGQFIDVAGREAAEQVGVPKGGLAWALDPYRRLVHNIRTSKKIPYGPVSIPSAIDPLAQRGWRKPTAEMQALGEQIPKNVPMEAGERMYEVVEFVNRVGYAEALAKKGYSPSEIKHLVIRSQFDYAKQSGFEKAVLSRSVLFLGWPRNNVPFQISKLIARPGGRTAQTFRALSTAAGGQDDEGHTPAFLGERIAKRFGGPDEAAQFIAGSGLPIEEFNKLVAGDPRRTTEKLLSYLHPLLQAPGELATGRQFFSGRRIEDLQGVTGIGPVDRLLHYAPVSRVVSEGRGVLDPRKAYWQRALNALTGLKTSTYDTEYWRIRDLEQAVRRQLQADPLVGEGAHYYVPKDQRGTPQVEGALRRLKQHQALRARLAKLREQKDLGAKKR